MRIALIGATGFVGRVAARDLGARPEVSSLLLVDYDIRGAKKLAKSISPKCRWAMADAGRLPELERVLPGLDALASAVGPCAEYERGILLACASGKIPAASVGDGPLPEGVRREIHDAFRRAGVPAVSGCGLAPGWTELLAARVLPPRRDDGSPETSPFLFLSPARFGGYAFCRRVSRARRTPLPPPPGAPGGGYLGTDEGILLGFPPGRPLARAMRLLRLAALGPAGREFAAAFLHWLRGWVGSGEGPSAVAGVAAPADGAGGGIVATVTDPEGRLPGVLLARTALLLAGRRGEAKGLLPLPELVSRREAESIAAETGGRISAVRS